MNIVIFDTETTGLPKPMKAPMAQQPRIIEIGLLYIDHRGNITRTMDQLIDPGADIYNPKDETNGRVLDPFITQATGIKIEDLDGQPAFSDILPVFTEFMRGADALIAHNAAFDKKMVDLEMMRLEMGPFPYPSKIICTVQEYTAMMGKWPKLTELYAKIMGKSLQQDHRGLSDCYALWEILQKDEFVQKLEQ